MADKASTEAQRKMVHTEVVRCIELMNALALHVNGRDLSLQENCQTVVTNLKSLADELMASDTVILSVPSKTPTPWARGSESPSSIY
ncbi:hypothetical protein Pelo_5064 [Pelomyxa schiedti]|nr:hypothetical protein Pelo_5064 [Pelomyxa schiedti]